MGPASMGFARVHPVGRAIVAMCLPSVCYSLQGVRVMPLLQGTIVPESRLARAVASVMARSANANPAGLASHATVKGILIPTIVPPAALDMAFASAQTFASVTEASLEPLAIVSSS